MSKKPDLKSQLQRLQQVSAVVNVVLAGVAAFVMGSATYQLTLGHQAKDALASQNGATVLAPAERGLFDLQLRYVVVTVLLLAAVYSALLLSRLRKQYGQNLKDGISPLRWIYFAVSSALIVETVALLSGLNDLITLKLIGALVGTSAFLGWLAERANRKARNPEWLPFGLSIFTAAMSLFVVGASLIGTYVFGMERNAWYVYALYATLVGSGLLTALNLLKQHRGAGKWKEYNFTERNYLLIDLLTKLVFAVIVIFGLKG